MTVTAGADSNQVDGSATVTHTVAGGDYSAGRVTAASILVTEKDKETDQECTPEECDDDLETIEDTDLPEDPETLDPVDEPEVIEEPQPVVVSLVRVPDGTVIPDNSTVSIGGTVLDGSTFEEGERAWFRILLSTSDGGPAPGGADVELSFQWRHYSPLVPTSGQISRVVFSLPRADVWDTYVQIKDNTVGNPDSTLTVTITGCERNGCVIGTPSQITLTIADDDGGPAAAPPGQPERTRAVCPADGHGSADTRMTVMWQAPKFEGGAPIDYYEVHYRRIDLVDGVLTYSDWQIQPHGSAATSTTITSLDTETAYGIRIRAVNANGPGEWSAEISHSTGEADQYCDILDEEEAN